MEIRNVEDLRPGDIMRMWWDDPETWFEGPIIEVGGTWLIGGAVVWGNYYWRAEFDLDKYPARREMVNLRHGTVVDCVLKSGTRGRAIVDLDGDWLVYMRDDNTYDSFPASEVEKWTVVAEGWDD